MIGLVYPTVKYFRCHSSITLEIGELEDYDFNNEAIYIYHVLDFLADSNIVQKRYKDPGEVLETIYRLLADLDLDHSDLFQSSELGNIRVELRDDLFSIEIYIGV